MIRGELAVIVLVIALIATIIDLFSGHPESVGTMLVVLLVSAVFTAINYAINRIREKNQRPQ